MILVHCISVFLYIVYQFFCTLYIGFFVHCISDFLYIVYQFFCTLYISFFEVANFRRSHTVNTLNAFCFYPAGPLCLFDCNKYIFL